MGAAGRSYLTPDDLLIAVAAGDRHAFGLFYDRVAGMILGLTRTILRDQAAAEEMTGEIFLQLWRTAGQYSRESGSAVAWAMAQAHRMAVERARAISRSPASDPPPVPGPTPVPGPPPVTGAAPGPVTVLDQAPAPAPGHDLAELTEAQRELLGLAYYRGQTYREISRTLRLTPATVRDRIHETLLRLRNTPHLPLP